jgi:hypothetical protein
MPSQWTIAGSGSSSRRLFEALIVRQASPALSPALAIPARLVPSTPVLAVSRMNGTLTSRPKWRQTMARQAAPQSASSSWKTCGKRRMRFEGFANVASASGVSAGVSATGAAAPASSTGATWTAEAAGRISSAKSSGTRARSLYS